MSSTRCVISLATSERPYRVSLKRLQKSLRRVKFGDDVLLWPPGAYPEGCPSHMSAPFAFKPFCFAEARDRGFEHVLWLDSSCLAVRKLDSLFAEIESRGYLLFRNARYKIGEWASDTALGMFGLDREEAMRLAEVNAAAIGLNMTNSVAVEFLTRWQEAAEAEVAFRGVEEEVRSEADYRQIKWNESNRVSPDPRVRGHRHDQTVAGILAHRLDMQLSETGLQPFRKKRRFVFPNTVVLKCRATARTDVLRARIGRPLGHIAHLRER